MSGYFCNYNSPLGPLWLGEKQEHLTFLVFSANDPRLREYKKEETPLLKLVIEQLTEYFFGSRQHFAIPLCPKGTDFQQQVWQALRAIPYGETRTYKEIAQSINNPKASRAVGLANNRNPISIIIPCHRVIGQNGQLTGYGGGLAAKEFLLVLEQKHV